MAEQLALRLKKEKLMVRVRSHLVLMCLLITSGPARPQGNAIQSVPVAENIHMLMGKGGNIGLFVGADGALLIDDKYAPQSQEIMTLVRSHTDRPVKFVINTHWHQDHTGGNETFGKADAVIVAHEKTRAYLAKDQTITAFDRRIPAAPGVALPVVTFQDSITFHWNGDTLDIFHVENAHTGGDAVIHFKKANVIHMGDTFFNGFYPFIDVEHDASMDGMIAAADRILAMANDKTRIIPGHGPLADKADLQSFRDMLATVRDRVRKLKNEGKNRAAAIAAKPTADLDAAWGGGFFAADKWVGLVYDAL